MCKGSLRNEENGERKNRREENNWVRKLELKFGSSQDPQLLYLKVSDGNSSGFVTYLIT